MKREDQYEALVWALKLAFFCRVIGKEDEAIELACHVAELLTEHEIERAKRQVEKELDLFSVGESSHH
jgi:hypothetical protein